MLHKASTAAAKRYVRDIMPRIKKLFNEIANRANIENALSLTTQGFGGEKMPLKYTECLEGVSDTTKKVVIGEVESSTKSQRAAQRKIPKMNDAQHRGQAFEERLVKELGGTGSFKKTSKIDGTREFDGAAGDVWYEAKAGGYWDKILSQKNGVSDFKSKMERGRRIALENGATYKIYSEKPIPDEIKSWLASRDIQCIEWK